MNKSQTTKRVPILMIGTFYKGKQRFSITRADVATMAANFKKRGNGEVVIDYEHASEMPEVAAGQPVPAAGWIVSIDPEPDADHIVWGEANFNARAARMIRAGEYKYGSPNLVWGYRDKSTGESQGLTLTSFALTNTPVLDGMPAIRLSEADYAAAQALATDLFRDTAQRLGVPYEEAAKAVLRDYPALAAKLFSGQ